MTDPLPDDVRVEDLLELAAIVERGHRNPVADAELAFWIARGEK